MSVETDIVFAGFPAPESHAEACCSAQNETVDQDFCRDFGEVPNEAIVRDSLQLELPAYAWPVLI